MRIVSIRIKNYKVFQCVEVNDITNMAVFVGRNGSGKMSCCLSVKVPNEKRSSVSLAMNWRRGILEI